MAGLFVLSAALLTLEVLQTRLFAYSLHTFLFYGAVGVTLLGLGASGTLLSLWRGWRERSLGTLGAVASAGFAISLVAAHAAFARISSGLAIDLSPRAFATFAGLAVPYFFAGIGITASLVAGGTGVHRVYVVNLLGSAVGCLVVFFALEPLGAPLLLGMTACGGVLAGGLFLRLPHGRAARVALVAAAAVTAVSVIASARLFPFVAEPGGQLAGLERATPLDRLHHVWDPTGRIEIHRLRDLPAEVPAPLPLYFFSQDGSAGSILLGVTDDLARARGFFERTLYGAPYVLRGGAAGANVLVIGLGGSPDVQAAHFFGARSVTGVEINASAIAAVAGPFAAFTGNPYGRPNARTVHLDGRTFVRSTPETFDLIVMSGVDTKSVLAAGSLSISENHLYTLEAFEEYLDRLAPGGVIAVLRFGRFDRLRLSTIGVAALRARGVAHPERHFAVLEQQAWTSVLVGRDPLPADAIARLAKWIASIPAPDTGIRLPPYDVFRLGLRLPPRLLHPGEASGGEPDAPELFDAVAKGREADFIAAHDLDISPPTDDRPFFFDFQRKDRIFAESSPIYRKLGGFLAVIGLLAAVTIAAPVPLLRRRTTAGGLGRVLAYFGALGTGFMLLEIGLAQKLVLFLGHPSYSVAVVLAALLVGAGLGSAAAGRSTLRGADLVQRRAVPAILVTGLVLALGLDALARVCAGLPLTGRLVVAAALLTPLGFALGMPFPTGLATLTRRRSDLVPWAIGANGLTSVVGASAALPAAMIVGYRAVLVAGLVAYVVAAFAVPRDDG
jgi:spermidine synthase